MNNKPDIKAFVAAKISEQFPGINEGRLFAAISRCADRNLKDIAHNLSSKDCPVFLVRK